MAVNHDFSLFTERKSKPSEKTYKVTDATIALNKSKSDKKKNHVKIKFYTAVIAILIVASFASILVNNSRLNEYADKISKVNQEILDLEAEETRLQMELEAKMSTRAAEEYARSVLGMQKIEPSQIDRIEGIKKNETETTEDKNSSILDLFK